MTADPDDHRLPYSEQDPDDIHTPAAEAVTTEQVQTARAAEARARGEAEGAVAQTVATVHVALEHHAHVVLDPIERARVAQLAVLTLERRRDALLKAAVEQTEHNAAEVARRVGVRPPVVLMALTRKP